MKPKLLILLLFGSLLPAACAPATAPLPTPDVNAIKTSVAQTVVAEITLTAAFFTPTPRAPAVSATPQVSATPMVSSSPTPMGTLVGCVDDSNYGDPLDVTIPDDTEMTANQTFIKTWTIKNTGTCPWRTGYTVVYGYGDDRMNGVPQPLTAEVLAGEVTEVTVEFRAPSKLGTYTSYWRMSSPNGGPFGKFFSVKIIVK